MSTDVIGSRYRVGSVVTCTPESTTWHARDTWLDEQVLSPGRGRAFLGRCVYGPVLPGTPKGATSTTLRMDHQE